MDNKHELEEIDLANLKLSAPVSEEDAKTKTFTTALPVEIDNPLFVYDQDGRILGAATLSLTPAGFTVTMELDAQTPERLTMETDPTSMVLEPKLMIEGDLIVGSFELRRGR